QAESLAARSRELLEKEKQLQSERQEWEQCRTAQTVTNVAMPADIEELRAELLKLRDSLYQQYRQRRDAVVAMREAVRHAASKVQEEKKILRISTEEHQLAAAALTGMQEQLQTEKNDLARQAKLLEEWQQQLLADQAAQRAEAEKFKNLQREYTKYRKLLE
ncbi:MAG TPA: hypothetical protein PKA06_14735, partial [Gemmatales bacterium]|nr:hypothetical protein [Gemmatales bacterium]